MENQIEVELNNDDIQTCNTQNRIKDSVITDDHLMQCEAISVESSQKQLVLESSTSNNDTTQDKPNSCIIQILEMNGQNMCTDNIENIKQCNSNNITNVLECDESIEVSQHNECSKLSLPITHEEKIDLNYNNDTCQFEKTGTLDFYQFLIIIIMKSSI